MPVLSLACHLPHNTPNIPSRYNNEQTTKQRKAINNSYIYIYIYIYISSCKLPDISPLMLMSRPVACMICWPVLFRVTSLAPELILTPVHCHYNDVTMSTVASQITSLSIVCPTVCSGADQRKHHMSARNSPVPDEFPAQRTSNAENVSIWWRHHIVVKGTPQAPWRISHKIYMR